MSEWKAGFPVERICIFRDTTILFVERKEKNDKYIIGSIRNDRRINGTINLGSREASLEFFIR